MLHPGWLEAVDAVAREHLGPSDRTGAALADEVRALSAVYNRLAGALRDQEGARAARLRFFLPRDLPKVAGPLAELREEGALPGGPVWRVLDLGAGLGATGLGAAAFAAGVPGVERLEIHAVERDARALDLYAALAARCGRGELEGAAVPVTLTRASLDLERALPDGVYDLVLVGLTLNELFGADPDPVGRRVAWLSTLAERLAPGGSLVVVEPALREPTRQLMAARDRLVAGDGAARVFGPCTHDGACPLLERDRDWCHAVRDVALPTPLAEVARAAGLRFERLTWAALVLRADGRRRAPGAWRVVGGPLPSKGKTEWELCGPGGRARLTRLDRHRGPDDPLEGAERGTLLHVDGAVGERIRSDRVAIRRVGSGE